MQDGRKVIRLEKRDKDANRIHVWLFRIEIKKRCIIERGIVCEKGVLCKTLCSLGLYESQCRST